MPKRQRLLLRWSLWRSTIRGEMKVARLGIEKKENVAGLSKTLVEMAVTAYGPYAFGVASLLLIWFTIVAPELDSRRIDYDRQEAIVTQQQQVAETMRSTALTMQATATVMDTTAKIMSRTVENMGTKNE